MKCNYTQSEQSLIDGVELSIDYGFEVAEEDLKEYYRLTEEHEMTFDEYQKEAMRTASGATSSCDKNLLLNGVMGLNGEAGECIDIVKKHMFQGHELDKEHIAKELSDCLWYIAVAAEGIGYKLSEVAQMNVDKLRKRYPDGFTVDNSLHRKDGDI